MGRETLLKYAVQRTNPRSLGRYLFPDPYRAGVKITFMTPKHTNGSTCLLCDLKLERVHAFLVGWVRGVRAEHPDVHVSWGYRDQASQDAAVAAGTSKDPWPTSLHNHNPSDAVDLFQLDGLGNGLWNSQFMRQIDTQNVKNGIKVQWGGNYPGGFKDFDHFYRPKS